MKLRITQALIGILLSLLPAAAAAQSYTIAPTPFQTALDNSGHIINNACVWTYLAGTTTLAATYSDTAGTANLNPIRSDSAGRFTAYLVAGSNYKFVYESSCTPPAHGSVLRTADPIAGTPASAATVDQTGTAGETISAGQCAYLSDGSGGKNATQWYKCDSANAYSSTLPIVGLAPSAIVSGASGTIRLSGAVSGLAVSASSTYYVGTAGAITSTAPVQARRLGVADSATTLVLRDLAPPTQAWVDDFRLTLTTAVPITTTDVTGASATTVFCSPLTGNRIDLPDSLGNPQRVTSAEFSIALPASTNTNYDVFAFLNGATATLELLAWTNDVTRATAVTRTNGRYFKSGDATRLYLGTVRTAGVNGQSEDSAAKRLLWNYYNRVKRPLLRTDSTATWTYTTATYRQANGAAANQVGVVVGIVEAPLEVTVVHSATNSGAAPGVLMATAIGLDGVGTLLPNQAIGVVNTYTGAQGVATAAARYLPSAGYHFYVWMEYSTAAGTTTWTGTNASAPFNTSGMLGSVEG